MKKTLEECVAMFLGKPPHDKPSNICRGDGYFALDCEKRFGEKIWNDAVEKAKKQ